jgi:tetratricopeptide (TPR) repeat protein
MTYVASADEIEYYRQRSLDLFRELDDVRGQGFVYLAMGNTAARRSKQFDLAERYYAQAYDALSRDHFYRPLEFLLHSLTWTLYAQNKVTAILGWAERTVAIYQETSEPLLRIQAAQAAAYGLKFVGDFAQSLSILEESLRLIDEHHLKHLSPISLTFAAGSALHLGRQDWAASYGEQGIRVARRIGEHVKVELAECLFAKSAIALSEDDFELTRSLIAQMMEVRGPWITEDRQARGLAMQAYIWIRNGQYDEARQQLHKSLDVTVTHRHFVAILWILPIAALLIAKQDNLDRATQIYDIALQQPYIRHSRWFETNVGDKLREIGIAVDYAEGSSHQPVDIWAEAAALLETTAG